MVTVFLLNTVGSAVPSSGPSPGPAPSSSQNSPKAVLDLHNMYRAEVGVRPMTWDKVVAAYAQNLVNRMIADCGLIVSDGPYGENNLLVSDTNLSVTDAVKRWGDEKDQYDFKSNTCVGSFCNHYTQIIWGSSIRLGCAKAICKDGGAIVVCCYDPRGNLPGQRPTGGGNQSTPPATPPSSAVADPPTIPPGVNNFPFQLGKKRNGILVGSIVGVCVFLSGLGFILFLCWRKGKDSSLDEISFDVSFRDEFGNGMGPSEFSYNELSIATKNFAGEEKLGEGGFGSVYKGFLRDLNTNVAVKKVSRRSKQGIKEYISEVKIISRLRHKNLVKLIGWCHEKELLLVYEFMPNGSLDTHLFKGRSLLPWKLRHKIVQDLASALLYLHEEGDFCVLHRDIKTNNIMLDSTFNAKLGDFGLARLVDHEKGSRTTLLAGTIGYIAPECHRTGKSSKESDIYSFGVVILEIACGRRSIEPRYDEGQASLVAWVWQAYGNQRLLDVIDKKLSEDFDLKEIECLLIVGLWCVHPIYNMRPSIEQAIQVLNFEVSLPNLPSEMPVPKYNIPNTPTIKISEPCLSKMSITVPR
ncbi:hypothetical protein SLEP1_g35897 [Rubroshorea leprosula]|uniref:Protein kinase domain-containing protein n=1 Tax=Rubroshorea leprosula TaxID=152421 RepID=A0AAV5KQ73_9ROSI|nr:hypothetical protein SLEP1_g35897 [Rubroshorea leprosula]